MHPYSHHGFTYAPIAPPLMARWDESTAKVRSQAGRKNKIDDGIVSFSTQNYICSIVSFNPNFGHLFKVVMNIAEIRGHTKFEETRPTSSANERIHGHEGVNYQPRQLEQSINKQQVNLSDQLTLFIYYIYNVSVINLYSYLWHRWSK